MDLKEIRKSIDDTDKKIALLLQKRMTLSKAVADYKIQNNITVHNEMREREVLENQARVFPFWPLPAAPTWGAYTA